MIMPYENLIIVSAKDPKPKYCGCGRNSDLEKHHLDYNKIDEIVWMCQSCHQYWHKHHKHEIVRSKKFEKYKIVLKEKKITFIQLAIYLHVSYTTVMQWARGVTEPNEENMAKLKEVLGIAE